MLTAVFRHGHGSAWTGIVYCPTLPGVKGVAPGFSCCFPYLEADAPPSAAGDRALRGADEQAVAKPSTCSMGSLHGSASGDGCTTPRSGSGLRRLSEADCRLGFPGFRRHSE